MRDLTLYLRDILAAMEAVEEFVVGIDFDAFLRDLKTRSAVIHQLGIMGEAAKMIPPEIRAGHPEVA
jgi:uncharacterized protein with HEPN domain